MNAATRTLLLVAAILSTIVVLAAIGAGLYAIGLAASLPIDLFILLGIGWVGYMYLRYLELRRDELTNVIAMAVEAQLPLPSAIRAYVNDRPSSGQGGWNVLLLFLFPPAYWLWQARHNFDIRANHLAESLEDGSSLPDALRSVGGVATSEVKVAAAVGESTGRLAECLRRADRDRAANAWLEIIPRVLYPLLLLIFIFGVTSFLMIYIVPRMKRIFDDFKHPLPDLTTHLIAVWSSLDLWAIPVILGAFGVIVVVAAIIASPWIRWHFPVLKWIYRWDVQGLILRMLGAMIENRQTAPAALARLEQAADLPQVVVRRLTRARSRVEAGEPLAAAMTRAGLLPRSMAPLVQSAERTDRLPWALSELGEMLAGRSARWIRRVSYFTAPMFVIAIGALTGLIVVGMFIPLTDLLNWLSA